VVLLADPRPASRVTLSVGLRGGGGIIDVREAGSAAEVDAAIAAGFRGIWPWSAWRSGRRRIG